MQALLEKKECSNAMRKTRLKKTISFMISAFSPVESAFFALEKADSVATKRASIHLQVLLADNT
jgi:hypothetical protein